MSVASSSAEISSDDRASENNSPARDLDLPALGAALWRKRWRILIPTLLTALGAFIAVQLITPKYFSEARILIESRSNVYLRPDADKITTDPTIDAEAVASQAQIISVTRPRARSHQQAQARRFAGIRFDAQRRIADQILARHARSRQGSAEHDA